MTKFERAAIAPVTAEKLKKDFGHLVPADHDFQEEADHLNSQVWWRNDVYQVAVTQEGQWCHLSIKRNDRLPIKEWRDMQQIKNELVGPEWEAVELYPAESRLVDTANQYHLWIFTGEGEGFKWPFGYRTRKVLDGTGEIDKLGFRQQPLRKTGDET